MKKLFNRREARVEYRKECINHDDILRTALQNQITRVINIFIRNVQIQRRREEIHIKSTDFEK